MEKNSCFLLSKYRSLEPLMNDTDQFPLKSKKALYQVHNSKVRVRVRMGYIIRTGSVDFYLLVPDSTPLQGNGLLTTLPELGNRYY